MMIKILGCILVLIAFTMAGFFYADVFRYRVKELRELERSIYHLQNEIIYTHTSLPEALLNISYKSKKPIGSIYEKISRDLSNNKYDSVYDAFKNTIEEVKCTLNLKKDDINVILDLAKTLGESDINGQVSMFSLTIENLKKQINEAEELMVKSVKMYRYLGFSIGAMIVIMLL